MNSLPIGAQRQNKVKRIWLVVSVVASLLSGLQAATQYVAFRFHEAAVLGASLYHLYFPWACLSWAHQWQTRYPALFSAAAGIGVMITSAGLMGILCLRHQISKNVPSTLHGSARFATKKDIKAAQLLSPIGVYVGAFEDSRGKLQYLRHNGPEHVLTYAPTRSGKGVGLVIPTLLSWPHSALITDLKGELWAMTAGWRKQHANNTVILFEPANPLRSARWNPLNEIRLGTRHEVGDVQNLATLVVDPDGKGLQSHWQKTSMALLVGLILHAIYTLKAEGLEANFPRMEQLLVDPNRSIRDLLTEMMHFKHIDDKTHPLIQASARDMLDRAEEEASSVLSTLKSYLALYRDPVVAQNVSTSDFCITDLMHHDKPVSLYICTEPTDKDRLRPLIRLLLNMTVRRLTCCLETITPKSTSKHAKHRLLCMVDEFPSLGKLDILQESLSYVAAYGIKFYLICQDINQLKSRECGYGPDETITSNCHIQNAFPPNRLETAEYLSKLTGQTTVSHEQVTVSGRQGNLLFNQVSKTRQAVQRPLLTPDECLRLPGAKKNQDGDIVSAGDMLIYVAGFPVIYGKQPLYFQDPVFRARAAIPAPDTTDRLSVRLEDEEMIRL